MKNYTDDPTQFADAYNKAFGASLTAGDIETIETELENDPDDRNCLAPGMACACVDDDDVAVNEYYLTFIHGGELVAYYLYSETKDEYDERAKEKATTPLEFPRVEFSATVDCAGIC